MTSYTSGFAQNVTRSYVVTQDENNGENGAYFFKESDIDAWYTANKSKITKVGRVYIIPGTASGSTFNDVVRGQNGATVLDYTNGIISDRKTVRDMGKEIIIGDGDDTRLLVLRRVQSYSNSTVGYTGDPDYNGYIVVENNCENLAPYNWGKLTVRVARI